MTQRFDRATLKALLDRHGRNSNSFLSLYDGYRYFRCDGLKEPGVLPYHDAPHAWVGAAEPMGSEADDVAFLRAFAEAARAAGKRAMFLPVARPFMQLAVAHGYGAIQVGTEPLFSLAEYQPSIERVSTAKRLYSRGGRVTEIVPRTLTRERRAELDRMVAEWILSRKMGELGYLNRVHPWELEEDKRYFQVSLDGKVVAFLAAVPTPRERSWYLVDVFRFTDSPPGATELLILESMRLLKESGALRVSLGVAPLSGLEAVTSPAYPTLHRLMRLAYERGGALYNFRSLHQFKLKFHPTSIEPAYLLFSPPELGFRNALGMLETFTGGPVRALWSGARHQVARYRVTRRRRVTHTLVPRSPVRDERHWLSRAPLTLALLAASGISFALVGRHGLAVTAAHAASWAGLSQGAVGALARAPFFHRGYFHFTMSVLGFFLFAGRLEAVAGTSFTALSFLLPAAVSLPATAALFFATSRAFHAPHAWERFSSLVFVGPSVGLFGCLGALTTFFEHGQWFLVSLLGLSVVDAIVTGSGAPLVHLTAAVLGVAAARWLTARQRFLQ